MHSPYCKWHLSEQICPLLSAIHTFSLIPCCSNYCSLFYWRTSFLFRKLLCGMPVYGYKQNGSSQMFFQPVFFAPYLDIFCTYTLLTLAVTTFYPWFSIYFLSISSETFPTLHAKYPSVQNVRSFQNCFIR